VRLYASKMRTDAKMGSLAADLEDFKRNEAPDVLAAQKVRVRCVCVCVCVFVCVCVCVCKNKSSEYKTFNQAN